MELSSSSFDRSLLLFPPPPSSLVSETTSLRLAMAADALRGVVRAQSTGDGSAASSSLDSCFRSDEPPFGFAAGFGAENFTKPWRLAWTVAPAGGHPERAWMLQHVVVAGSRQVGSG